MALDKQRILSELGSVVNQLQSADCGCMGKLFSNSNTNESNMNFQPVAGQGCGQCHHHSHGHHGGCCRNSSGGDPNHCLGHCNPPKLYHDTYNYLNKNLMQPVVNEVYNDLKTLNPNNTMSNSPLAAQLGLPSPQGNAFNQNNSPTACASMGQHNSMGAGNMNEMGARNMNQMGTGNIDQMGEENMNQMGGGMGPAIIKNMSMFNENSQAKKNRMNAGNMNQVQGVNYQTQNNMPSAGGYVGMYGNMSNNMNPSAGSGAQQITSQPMQNAQQNNPISRGGAAVGHHLGHHHAHTHGKHQAGMTKFSEMFPAVMQGDLGFDPMALAIQMNPENQKKNAIDTMQSMLMKDKRRAMNVPEVQTPEPKVMAQQNVNPNQQAGSPQMVQQQGMQRAYVTNINDSNTMQSNAIIQGQKVVQYQQSLPSQGQFPLQQQQVYTALTQPPSSQVVLAAPVIAVDGQQNAVQATAPPTAFPAAAQQYATPPPSGTAQFAPTPGVGTLQYATATASRTQQYASTPPAGGQQYGNTPVTAQCSSLPQGTIDATYAVDPRNLSMEYNTLGQPVEMVSADAYKVPYDNVPITLSPTPMPMKSLQRRYSNVKNTVSKTSLTGNVLGSKTLQHAYDVYKTQQSLAQPSFGSTAPYVVRSAAPMGSPIERFSGDVLKNENPMPPMKSPAQEIMGRMGDAPMPSPIAEDPSKIPFAIAAKEPPKHTKGRNGIQDQTFTQYPMSTSWSFHGTYR